MIDSLLANIHNAQQSDILERLGAKPKSYGLVTLHRPSNVDDPAHLAELVETLSIIAAELPLYLPVHPRTRTRMAEHKLSVHPDIHLTDPLGYLDFLWLMSNSSVVLTDSGGIQEETTMLGVPCLALCDNTERPATIEEGTNILAGTRKSSILDAWCQMKQSPKAASRSLGWQRGRAMRGRAAGVLHRAFAALTRGRTGYRLTASS